jgi:hypothetical protein
VDPVAVCDGSSRYGGAEVARQPTKERGMTAAVQIPDGAYQAARTALWGRPAGDATLVAQMAVEAAAPHIAKAVQLQVLREMMKGPVGDEQWTLGLIVGRISTRILELEGWERT